MKVIIVEVTRAANSFGQTHLATIGEAYALIGDIVTKAQESGEFKPEISSQFAAMTFYGAIEQVLTGWIFGLLPSDDEYSRWPRHGRRDGLRRPRRRRGRRRARSADARLRRPRVSIDCGAMQNDMVKRLAWSGLLAGVARPRRTSPPIAWPIQVWRRVIATRSRRSERPADAAARRAEHRLGRRAGAPPTDAGPASDRPNCSPPARSRAASCSR